MALSNITGTHIHHLPNEMIDYILDFLPLRDRKSSSLVCQRWATLAFSYRYLANVQLTLEAKHLEEQRTVVDVLDKSWRRYRNLTVDFGSSDRDVVLILVILQKFGRYVEIFDSPSFFTPEQLRQMLQRLPRLRRLIVNANNEWEVHWTPEELPVLQHVEFVRSTDAIFDIPGLDVARMMPSVQNLSVYFRYNVTSNSYRALQSLSPRLKSLEVYADCNQSPIEQLDFRQLEMLKLWGTSFCMYNGPWHKFFMGIPKLNVAFLHIQMSMSLLEVICEHCPQLTTFGFIADNMEHGSLWPLEKLKNLKVLVIDGCLQHHMIDGCNPLPSVETFCLYWYRKFRNQEAFVKQLNYMLPNVRTLKVLGTRDKEMDSVLMAHIARTFTKLNQLTVGDFKFPHGRHLVGDGFDWVGDLVNVEQLTLQSLRLMEITSQRQSNVKQLQLKNFDWLGGDNLLMVAKIFPRLTSLNINRCPQITAKDVEKAQRVMPNCTINFMDRKPRWSYHSSLSVL